MPAIDDVVRAVCGESCHRRYIRSRSNRVAPMMQSSRRNTSGPDAGNAPPAAQAAHLDARRRRLRPVARRSRRGRNWERAQEPLRPLEVQSFCLLLGPATAVALAMPSPAEASPAERMSARRSNVISERHGTETSGGHHARAGLTRLNPRRAEGPARGERPARARGKRARSRARQRRAIPSPSGHTPFSSRRSIRLLAEACAGCG